MAKQKRISLRDRVDQMCKQCIYDPCVPMGWVEQVAVCGDKTCPLHDARPKTNTRVVRVA